MNTICFFFMFFCFNLTQTVKGGRLLFHFTPHHSSTTPALLQPFYNQYVTLHIYPRVICNSAMFVNCTPHASYLRLVTHVKIKVSDRSRNMTNNIPQPAFYTCQIIWTNSTFLICYIIYIYGPLKAPRGFYYERGCNQEVKRILSIIHSHWFCQNVYCIKSVLFAPRQSLLV